MQVIGRPPTIQDVEGLKTQIVTSKRLVKIALSMEKELVGLVPHEYFAASNGDLLLWKLHDYSIGVDYEKMCILLSIKDCYVPLAEKLLTDFKLKDTNPTFSWVGEGYMHYELKEEQMLKQGDKVIVTIHEINTRTILKDLPTGEYVGTICDTNHNGGAYILLKQISPLVEFNSDGTLLGFSETAPIRPAIAVRGLMELFFARWKHSNKEEMERIKIWHNQRASVDKKDVASKGLYYSLKAEEELRCFTN